MLRARGETRSPKHALTESVAGTRAWLAEETSPDQALPGPSELFAQVCGSAVPWERSVKRR